MPDKQTHPLSPESKSPRVHTGTIRHCPRCLDTDGTQMAFKGRYVPVDAINDLERRHWKLREAASWLLQCKDDVNRGVPVRGLDEAWAGLRAALSGENQ